MSHTTKGIEGEQIARRFCERRGWRILATNWRSGRGEIDLIADDAGVTVFVEVKYRSTELFGAPEEALTSHKQHMLRQTISGYCARHPLSRFRVDIIALSKKDGRIRLRHLKDVELLPK